MKDTPPKGILQSISEFVSDGMLRKFFLGPAVILLLVAGVLPVLMMLLQSLIPEHHFSLEAYRNILSSPRQWTLLSNSLKLAGLSSLGALLLGLPAGFLITRTRLPGRRTFAALLAMPLLLPPYLNALAWMAAVSERGPLALIFGRAAAEKLSQLLFGLPGCVLVLTTAFMPLMMFLVAAALQAVPSRLEEAGLMVARRPIVFRRITLPLIFPSILFGSVLVFLLALGEISVPPSLRYPVFAVESLSQFSAFYDISTATAAAMPLVLLTAALLGIEALVLRRLGPLEGMGRGMSGQISGRKPGWPMVALTWLTAFLLVGFPLIVLLRQAGAFGNYLSAFNIGRDGLLRGLGISAAGGFLLAIEGFLLAVLYRERRRLGSLVDAAALFLFAVPGAVLGVGLIVLWNHPWGNIIYATPLILLLGYVARYTILSLRLNRASMALLPESLIEAARVSGVGWGRRLLWIIAPGAWRGIAAAGLVCAIFCLRDLGLTLLVHPPGSDTLPVQIMTLSANGAPHLIAALCLILVFTTAIPLVFLNLVLGKWELTR